MADLLREVMDHVPELRAAGVPRAAGMALLGLARSCDEQRTIAATLEEIAKCAWLTPTQAARGIALLIDLGLVTAPARADDTSAAPPSVYRITDISAWLAARARAHGDDEKGEPAGVRPTDR